MKGTQWWIGLGGMLLLAALALGWAVGRAGTSAATGRATPGGDVFQAWAAENANAGGPICRSDEDVAARMFLFYRADCPDCQRVLQEILPPLQKKYGRQMRVRLFNVDIAANRRVREALERRYGVQGRLPELFVGDQVLIGSEEIRRELEPAIRRALVVGGIDWPAEAVPAGAD